jgi:hypothetical protein
VKIILQVGYSKSSRYRKEGQKVQAWVNDFECSWSDKAGQFLTSRVDASKGMLWYLWKDEVQQGDIIRIQVGTMIVGVGPDEKRTFEKVYYVDENTSSKDISISGVGARGYPLIKGKVVEMASVSAADKRESEVDEFLRDDLD